MAAPLRAPTAIRQPRAGGSHAGSGRWARRVVAPSEIVSSERSTAIDTPTVSLKTMVKGTEATGRPWRSTRTTLCVYVRNWTEAAAGAALGDQTLGNVAKRKREAVTARQPLVCHVDLGVRKLRILVGKVPRRDPRRRRPRRHLEVEGHLKRLRRVCAVLIRRLDGPQHRPRLEALVRREEDAVLDRRAEWPRAQMLVVPGKLRPLVPRKLFGKAGLLVALRRRRRPGKLVVVPGYARRVRGKAFEVAQELRRAADAGGKANFETPPADTGGRVPCNATDLHGRAPAPPGA